MPLEGLHAGGARAAMALPDLVESLVLCELDPAAPVTREAGFEQIAVPVLVAHGARGGGGGSLGLHRQLVERLGDARWLILGRSDVEILHGPEADVLLPAIRTFVLREAL